MKVPKQIQKSIEISYRHRMIANKHNDIVRDWMVKNSLHTDSNIDPLIDIIELGDGSPKDLIDYLENQAEQGENDD